MELDMLANFIAKDFNQFGKKPSTAQGNIHTSEANSLPQHVFPDQGMNRQEFLTNRSLSGARLLPNDSESRTPPSSDVINHILVSGNGNNQKIHGNYVQNGQPHGQQINNNILHGIDLQFSNEQFDVSNILNMNMSHINGHLQNVSLANTAHLGSNGSALSALPFPNGHHVVAAVASSSGNSSNNLLSHMNNSNSAQLNSHVQSNDSSNSNNNNGLGSSSTRTRHRSAANDSMFKCDFCPKKFNDQNSLQMHMEECRIIRSHECQRCGKRFKARGGLQQHNRIHLQERPYHCRYCPKRFNQKSHLDQHERIHTGMKPFACQFCGRAFRQRSQQMGHEATHTNSGSVIASSGSLSLHQISNPGQLPAATMVQQSSLADASALLPRSSDRSSLSSE